jgi:glutathione S-transferase
MIPVSDDDALTVRFMDRFFDNYVMSPMQTLVADRMRTQIDRDAKGVADARKMLEVAYGWLEEHLMPQAWASGSCFSLADCCAAPALFYADWVHQVGDRFPAVLAYRSRLLARPSVARVVDEARPFRKLFPKGAPDRD